jgi:hypothetical protein
MKATFARVEAAWNRAASLPCAGCLERDRNAPADEEVWRALEEIRREEEANATSEELLGDAERCDAEAARLKALAETRWSLSEEGS